jgi:hypothetical protein
MLMSYIIAKKKNLNVPQSVVSELSLNLSKQVFHHRHTDPNTPFNNVGLTTKLWAAIKPIVGLPDVISSDREYV